MSVNLCAFSSHLSMCFPSLRFATGLSCAVMYATLFAHNLWEQQQCNPRGNFYYTHRPFKYLTAWQLCLCLFAKGRQSCPRTVGQNARRRRQIAWHCLSQKHFAQMIMQNLANVHTVCGWKRKCFHSVGGHDRDRDRTREREGKTDAYCVRLVVAFYGSLKTWTTLRHSTLSISLALFLSPFLSLVVLRNIFGRFLWAVCVEVILVLAQAVDHLPCKLEISMHISWVILLMLQFLTAHHFWVPSLVSTRVFLPLRTTAAAAAAALHRVKLVKRFCPRDAVARRRWFIEKLLPVNLSDFAWETAQLL